MTDRAPTIRWSVLLIVLELELLYLVYLAGKIQAMKEIYGF